MFKVDKCRYIIYLHLSTFHLFRKTFKSKIGIQQRLNVLPFDLHNRPLHYRNERKHFIYCFANSHCH